MLRILPHKALGGSLQPFDEKTARFMVARLTWDRLIHCIPWLSYVALKMDEFAFWGSILAGAITLMGADGRLPNVVHFGSACIKYTFEAATAQLEHHLQSLGLNRLTVLANVNIHNPTAVQWYTRYTHDILRSTAHFSDEEVEILVGVAIQDTSFFNNM